MQMAPQVYDFTRQIGARPSRLQQGLRAVGRGLAVAGGAGLAIGVANSLFNKPSDNYRQSVTNNQTTVGKDARTATQTTYDEANTTVAEGLTGKIDQYLSNPIGPHPVGTETHRDQNFLLDPSGQAGRRSRMAKLSGQEFSPSLRYGGQDDNIAAFKAENEAALRGESPTEYQISNKDAADIAAAENMPASPTVQADETARKMRQRQHIENSQMLPYDSPLRSTFGGKTNPPEETTLMDMMSDDAPISDKVVSFINKTKKDLPEKKTLEISDLGQRRDDNASAGMKGIIAAGGDVAKAALEQTPDIDLSEIENDSALADIGRREEPKDISPRGSIPPDKSGTMNKTDLGAIGDIIGEKQADNPIVGGLQGIGKAARIAGKIGKRTVEELADKGAKDRRNYAKYKETIRKAQAFKKIADDRENTETPE